MTGQWKLMKAPPGADDADRAGGVFWRLNGPRLSRHGSRSATGTRYLFETDYSVPLPPNIYRW